MGRTVLALTLLVVAGMGLWFAIARWDDASKVAAIASALGAVAAVGVAVWAALPKRLPLTAKIISGTSDAEAADGGDANTGLQGKARHLTGSVEVRNTGKATATGGGHANTGIRLD
ncbi:hypothetical protein [Saccharothrix luteola]|uniref:hypothetical protein n=1 Tax=Saccharothrix luteola TaxID=2893018 RepID=UPI001E51A5BA|nr:hypothetical protein [Saccharothrix luteola]MCC8243653.1 hypothetical protein [Saccharothrix luteola]